MDDILLDPKLYSKVLTIEPNRLFKIRAASALGVAQFWKPFNIQSLNLINGPNSCHKILTKSG